jgi:hypothetical protein
LYFCSALISSLLLISARSWSLLTFAIFCFHILYS